MTIGFDRSTTGFGDDYVRPGFRSSFVI